MFWFKSDALDVVEQGFKYWKKTHDPTRQGVILLSLKEMHKEATGILEDRVGEVQKLWSVYANLLSQVHSAAERALKNEAALDDALNDLANARRYAKELRKHERLEYAEAMAAT